MTDDTEAAEAAKQAKSHAKAAAQNAGTALKAVGEDAVETVAEEARETAERIEDTAERALDATQSLGAKVLQRITGDTAIGLFALSVSLYAGGVAVGKFRQAFSDSPTP